MTREMTVGESVLRRAPSSNLSWRSLVKYAGLGTVLVSGEFGSLLVAAGMVSDGQGYVVSTYLRGLKPKRRDSIVVNRDRYVSGVNVVPEESLTMVKEIVGS
ncbi:hypothetical protein vseg_012649 [Gypsophila vaccaria]